jgi:tRNA threonylcarbamoyladenosine biosynthesis protein TsaE
LKLVLKTVADTEWFGAALWEILPAKSLVFLNGELGAGKTALVRGVLRAAGYSGAVKSPTFTLVEEYEISGRKILHFDLYRLADPEELEWIGIRDYMAQTSLCFIEWPTLGHGFLPKPDLEITLTIQGRERIATVLSPTQNIEKSITLQCKNKDLLL